MSIVLKELPYWCSYFGLCLSFPWGLIYFEDLSIGGCTACAAFGTAEKRGLGCFVAGAGCAWCQWIHSAMGVTGCLCETGGAWISRDSGYSRSCCGKSYLALWQWIFHSIVEAGSFTDFFLIYLLLLCYFILFLDSFKLVTAATWQVIKSNDS